MTALETPQSEGQSIPPPHRGGLLATAIDLGLRVEQKALARLAFLAPLATRVVLGLAFQQTGRGKLANLERTTEFFAGLGIPAPAANAMFIGSLELVGGIALIVGLATRPFAALLSSTMLVALLTADRESFLASWSSSAEQGPTDIVPFVFLLFLIWLVLLGPGKASLDAWIVSRFGRDTGRR